VAPNVAQISICSAIEVCLEGSLILTKPSHGLTIDQREQVRPRVTQDFVRLGHTAAGHGLDEIPGPV
jgi:hypothetical protein